MKGKIIGFATLIAVLVLSAFIFFKFYFVFGEGVRQESSTLSFIRDMYSRHTKDE